MLYNSIYMTFWNRQNNLQIRIVVAWSGDRWLEVVQENFLGVIETFCILIVGYVGVDAFQNVLNYTLRSVHFSVCKFCYNKKCKNPQRIISPSNIYI